MQTYQCTYNHMMEILWGWGKGRCVCKYCLSSFICWTETWNWRVASICLNSKRSSHAWTHVHALNIFLMVMYICVSGKMRGIELGRHRSERTCAHVVASTDTRMEKIVGDNLLHASKANHCTSERWFSLKLKVLPMEQGDLKRSFRLVPWYPY